jgi:hypothetical protein
MEPAARAAFAEHWRSFCDNYDADCAAFEARHTENAIRLALVLHAWGCVTLSDPADVFAHERHLSEQTARNAVRLLEWFTIHQRGLLAPHRQAARERNWEKVKALGQKERAGGIVAAGDLLSSRVVDNAKEAEQILQGWVTEGRLVKEEFEPTGKGGRPKGARYRLTGGMLA